MTAAAMTLMKKPMSAPRYGRVIRSTRRSSWRSTRLPRTASGSRRKLITV